jgi:hypothetical protein
MAIEKRVVLYIFSYLVLGSEAFQESLGFSPLNLFWTLRGRSLLKKNWFVKILLLVYYIMWSN